MREILFRGIVEKDRDRWNMAGKFAYGLLTRDFDGDYMIATLTDTSNGVIHQYIKEETLGQFTGLLDKNGKKIFEGDILQNETGDQITCIFEIKDGISLFNLFDEKNPKRMYFCIDKHFEIIGNIHEVAE